MQIQVIDLHFQGRPTAVASFLVRGEEGSILLECGPSSTLPMVRAALAENGLEPSQLKGVLVTHIHLDHAGAAGWWTEQGVDVYVHEFGAQHLIDPSKLLASATRIYGDRMQELWGDVLPCRPERVRTVRDGDMLELAGLRLVAHETPGHARHHHAFGLGDTIFTGDVAGVRLPQADFLSVPAPPPEFDLESWLTSLEKLRALKPERLFLTHFGEVKPALPHLEELSQRLRACCAFVGERRHLERSQLVQEYLAWNHQFCPDPQLFDRYEQANPLFMSVDGLLRYWKKKDAP